MPELLSNPLDSYKAFDESGGRDRAPFVASVSLHRPIVDIDPARWIEPDLDVDGLLESLIEKGRYARVTLAQELSELWRGLETSEQRTYLALCMFHDGFNNGRIDVSQSVLAHVSDQHRVTVLRALKVLALKGLIKMTPGKTAIKLGSHVSTWSRFRIAEFGSGKRSSKDAKYPVEPTLFWARETRVKFVHDERRKKPAECATGKRTKPKAKKPRKRPSSLALHKPARSQKRARSPV